MNNSLVLDTNIIIDILAQKISTDLFNFRFPDSTLTTGFMTRIELLSFPQNTPTREIIIKNFLDTLIVVSYNQIIEDYAINIWRNSHYKVRPQNRARQALRPEALGQALIWWTDAYYR
jgi:predicted nucleic acid-binding protein